MLFQVIHTHSDEDCPTRTAQQARASVKWWQAFKKTPGVKVMAGMAATLDHTFYITVEADDYQTLERALGPLLSIGTARVSPVLTLDHVLSMAETSAHRAAK